MRPQLQYLFSLILISATVASVVAIALPHESNSLDVGKPSIDVRSPEPYALGSASSDLALVPEAGDVNANLILGSLAFLSGVAIGTCNQQGVPAAITCVASGLATVAGALAAIWAAIVLGAAEEHYAALGMVAVHTTGVIPDTSLLLAENSCSGVGCNQLWYYHNSTSNLKKVSLVPKASAKRQDGDQNNGDPGNGGLFLDYIWNTVSATIEKEIGEQGASSLEQVVINAYANTEDNGQYASDGFYCASFFITGSFATQGAVFQNQGAPFPAQAGEAGGIIAGCPNF